MPTAIKSGNWTDPTVWDTNREPQPGERVIIPETYTVIYDLTFELMLRRIIRDQLATASQGNVIETSPFYYQITLATTHSDGSPVDPQTIRSRFHQASAIASIWKSVGYAVNLRFQLSQPAEDWLVNFLMSKPPIIGVTVQGTLVRVLVLSANNAYQSIVSAVRQAEQETSTAIAVLSEIEGRSWTAQFFIAIEGGG